MVKIGDKVSTDMGEGVVKFVDHSSGLVQVYSYELRGSYTFEIHEVVVNEQENEAYFSVYNSFYSSDGGF